MNENKKNDMEDNSEFPEEDIKNENRSTLIMFCVVCFILIILGILVK